MIYFGWARTSGTYAVFGVHESLLGFSAQDYLFRSLDATFTPLTAVLLVLLAAVMVHHLLIRVLSKRSKSAIVTCWSLSGVGLVLTLMGVAGLIELASYPGELPVTPLSLGFGVLLLGYAWSLAAEVGVRNPPEQQNSAASLDVLPRVALAAIVVIALFWCVAVIAQKQGREIARGFILNQSLARVEIFSAQRLHVAGPGVQETELPGTELRYRFRYSGLRFLVRSNGRYFVLPDQWRPGARAIVLPDDPQLRLELYR